MPKTPSSCSSGKRSFMTSSLAEEALIGLWSVNEYGSGSGPVAVYCCELCGAWHLTSRPPMNDRLSAALASGEIKLNREARRWEDKLR